MAESFGVSLRTYTDIESNERQLKLDELKVLSEKLGVPAEAFLAQNFSPILINNGDNSSYVTGKGDIIAFDKEFMQEMFNIMKLIVGKLGKLP